MNTPNHTNGNGKPRVVERLVKHTFSCDERNELGAELARTIAQCRGIANEFDQVKATYKARTTESEAKVDSLSTSLMNGFDLRSKRCVCVFKPKERKKFFYLEEEEIADESTLPVLVEDMTPEDFQLELMEAEAEFEKHEEIQLFPLACDDRGVMVVGRLAGKWHTALRIQVGQRRIDERLDREQRACKLRSDAIARGARRAQEWLTENLGKEAADGFRNSILDAVEEHKARVE